MQVSQVLTRYAVLSGALGLGWLSACGVPVPKVKPQPRDTIAVPEFPPLGESLQLNTQGDTAINFEGPTIFWQKNARPEVIAQSLAASLAIKEADAKFKPLKFKSDVLEQELDGLRGELERIASEPPRGNIERQLDEYYGNSKQLAVHTTGSAQWFKKRLDPAKADAFGNYCEARLVQFAASAFVADFDFKERPTPLILCEEYYAGHGFFSGDECAPAAEGQANNYFACFWGDGGVKHTKLALYEKSGEEASAADKEAVFSLFGSEGWREQAPKVVRASSLRQGDKLLILKIDGQLLSRLNKQAIASFQARDEEVIDWEGFMEERELLSGQTMSLHNRIFNIHRLGPNKEARAQFNLSQDLEQHLLTFTMQLGSSLPLERWKAEASEHAVEEEARWNRQKEELAAKITSRETALAALLAEAAPLQTEWVTKKIKSGWGILDAEQADALYPKTLVRYEQKDKLVQVTLRMDYATGGKARGCYDLDSRSALACPHDPQTIADASEERELEASYLPLNVSLDPETGLLALALELTSPDEFGLQQRLISASEREAAAAGREHTVEPAYQQWSADELRGKTLRFELYPRRYNADLRILSGKAFLMEGEREWSQASVMLSEYGEFPKN